MKILKKAEQKNVILNKDYYTVTDINDMLLAEKIFYFTKGCVVSHTPISTWELDDCTLRIFTDDLTELKVILDDDNFYTTVAVGKDGTVYHVIL